MDILDNFEAVAKIVIIGVGGAGNNAVNRMIDEDISCVKFYVANTDKQALASSKAENKIVLGEELTKGLGAGGEPEVGRMAAEASKEKIREIVRGADMVFIAAGMGGGTGTGAAPVIASIAKEEGILTVAIVTRPFAFEGKRRIAHSIEGLNALKEQVDSIIVVSNDKLLMMNGQLSVSDAFKEADKVLAQSVKTVTDLIIMPGVINLDFADVRNTLNKSGIALIGFGQGEGQNKALEAAQNAMSSPLLEASISGARRAIVSVTCGSKVSLFEAQETVKNIIDATGEDLDIKFGVTINNFLEDVILVSIIATDFAEEYDFTAIPTFDFVKQQTESNPKEEAKPNDDNNHSSILSSFLKRDD
ncbi:MAG: cell division protein FtsZ [Erysipelotrichaceae bacterium]|nr:cell division protein FtsZ [Erysipelotrichaceae bacterium]